MIPLADLIDSDLLPPLLQDFERIIGLAATLDLVRAYGGLRIYIPTPARVRPDHPIAKIIGVDALMALAEVYGQMVFARAEEIAPGQLPAAAMAAWLAWYETQPDTPCIAICSTSQGDDCCKGCGRSFAEVQHWLELSPADKRAVWRRITREGRALRFTRYAERAAAAG